MADDPDGGPAPHRRTALWVLLVAGAAFVGLAAALVPWQPVPGGVPDPAPVDRVLTAAQVARAEEFARWSRVWSWSSLALSLVVVCLVGFSTWARRLVARLPGPWWVQVLLAVAAGEVVVRLVTLPFAVLLRRHLLENGLSTQSWAGFARDLVVSELLSVAVTGLAMLVLVALARRSPVRWPAIGAGTVGALVVLGSFVHPVLVEPLFSSFEPLPEGSLRDGVLDLAAAEGVPVGEVLVADASRRTTTLNAYVSGFGGTRRVVLYDTLVDDAPEDEALSVVAHELAHARHDDVLVGTLLGATGAAAAVGLLGLLLGRRRSGDPAVVPLLLALLALGTLLSQPVENGISRRIELRADVDALAATGDPAGFVALQRRLAVRSLVDPTPPAWSQWWFASHPGVLTRVALADR